MLSAFEVPGVEAAVETPGVEAAEVQMVDDAVQSDPEDNPPSDISSDTPLKSSSDEEVAPVVAPAKAKFKWSVTAAIKDKEELIAMLTGDRKELNRKIQKARREVRVLQEAREIAKASSCGRRLRQKTKVHA